jgi:hypothetical protein
MIKLLPFLFIALPIAAVAQSKQQLVAQANYYHSQTSGLEKTDSSSYYYMQHSAAGKPAYLPEVQRWNCDTMYTYTTTNALETRTTNIYNTDGSLAECHTETLQGSLPIGILIMNYNANGKMTEKARWAKVSGSSQLLPYEKETYSYDANNNVIEYTWYDGDRLSVPASYIPITRKKYTYSVGTLTEILQEYYNSSGMWDAAMRTTYIYHTSTTMEELTEQSHGTNWQYLSRLLHTLDGNKNIVSSLRQEYISSNWENDNEHAYSYDAGSNMLSHEELRWAGSTRTPVNKTEYTYNSDNNMLTSLKKMWDGAAYVVKEGSAATYNYYGFPTGVDNAPSVQEEIDVYPIPASNTLHINMAATDSYHAYLYDATGKLAKTVSVKGLCTIDVQDLPAGNYVLQVNTNGNVTSRKVVIAR